MLCLQRFDVGPLGLGNCTMKEIPTLARRFIPEPVNRQIGVYRFVGHFGEFIFSWTVRQTINTYSVIHREASHSLIRQRKSLSLFTHSRSVIKLNGGDAALRILQSQPRFEEYFLVAKKILDTAAVWCRHSGIGGSVSYRTSCA